MVSVLMFRSVATREALLTKRTNYSFVSTADIKVQKGKNTAIFSCSSSTGSNVENSSLALGTNTSTPSSYSLHRSHTVVLPFQSQG